MLSPRLWFSLFAAFAVVLGLGCSLGGDGGGGNAEPLGSSRGAFVSDTEPLVCPTYALPVVPGGLLPPTPAGDAVAGSLAGAFEVNDAGAAVSSMRLEVPPGRAGIEPELTLTYDSDHENGLLGMGFRLGGLSAIRRCGHSYSDEGDLRAVAYDVADRFCLDGRKLFAVRGTYGLGDAEYRTEPDAFTRVMPQGDAAGGPLVFVAYAKDGRIYEYGRTADARVSVANGTVATWLLQRVRDRLGNFLVYEYEAVPSADGALEQRVKAIRYTGHTSGLAPERSVEFDYDGRWDVMTKYAGGEAFRVSRVLTGLRMYGPGHVPVRDYTFAYSESPSTQRARLRTVQACVGEGAARACLPATTFGWGDTPAGFSPDVLHLPSPQAPAPGFTRLTAVRTGDFNGDGTDDIAYLLDRFVPVGEPVPQALFVKYTYANPASAAPPVLVFDFEASTTRPPIADLTPLDHDEDGLVDLLVQRPATETTNPRFQWLRSTGEGFVDATPGSGLPSSQAVGPFDDRPGGAVATYYPDLNGDGHADVVSCRRRRWPEVPNLVLSYWTYQLHQPGVRGFGGARQLSYGALPGGLFGPLSSLDGKPCDTTDLVTFDLDGDGASELLFATRDATGTFFRALSVQGDRFVERTVSLPALAGESRVVPLDVNGDGLRDVVVLRPDPNDASSNVADAYVNTGTNLRLVATFEGPEMHEVHFQWGYVVLDYDGDGREDLLVSTGANGWRLLREVGPGGATHLQVSAPALPYSVPFDTPDRRFYRALDVDGDGDDDLLSFERGGEDVFLNARDELRQDRLLWVRDGRRSAFDDVSGGLRAMTLRVDYGYLIDRSRWPGHDPAQPARYRHDPTACAPEPSQRALRCFAGEKRVVTHTWTGGNGAEKLEHDFYYQDARFHRLGAGWLGFASRQIVEPARKRITELSFDNRLATAVVLPGHPVDQYPYVERFYTAGRPLTELTYSDPLWAGSSASSALSDVAYVTHAWTTAPAEGGATSYVYAKRHDTYRYQIADFRAPTSHPFPLFGPFDPTAHVPLTHASHEALEPDAFGHLARAVRHDGLVEETTVRVVANDTARWLLGLAMSIEQTSRPLGEGAPPPQTRQANVVYRPGTPLPSTLTLRDPNDSSSTLTESRLYDPYGNLTYSDRVDPQGRRRQTCLAYEPEGLFPGLVTHAAGHETHVVYDRALGVPLAAVDPNGLATRWSYDPFGRLARELSPEGADVTVTRTPVVLDDPTTGVADPVLFLQVDQRASGDERRELWSAEGRLVRVESRAFAGTFVANHAYDVTGRLSMQSAPTLVGLAAPGFTTYGYDAFDRPTRVTAPDGLTTTYAYEGLTTCVVGQYTPGGTAAPPAAPLLRTTRQEHDARGRVSRAIDAHEKATVYDYGAFDHLRRVTDPAGNVTTATTDAWGRPRASDDPDLGARTYTYTAFGQLETVLDAKNQLTRFVYDGLGRPAERHDADGLSTWTYDDVPFGVGKPIGSRAPGGVERAFTYDPKGRLETSKLQASLGDDVLTFTYGYDDAQFGRLRTLTYPSPAGVTPYRVRYGYDAFGHLEQLTDDASQAELWRQLAPAAGFADRQTLERFGNGVHTTRSFEPTNGRLTQLRSVKPSAGGAETVLQDLRYQYTHDRHLWRIDDAAQGPTARETFGYDTLDRLTLDAVQGPTGPRRDATYAYNELGNLTQKSDLGPSTLTYGKTTPQGLRLPHALTSFGSEIYDYDANGNQTRRPDASLTYNALDKPKTITAAGQPTTTFAYDAAGARVRKQAIGGLETLTFDDLYERSRLAPTSETKHTVYVRAGGQLVASVERRVLGTFVLGTTTRYVHPNHQGSTDVVTSPSGAVVQQRSYDPFGRARNPDWSTGSPPQGAALLRRGFTEHEHDDEFGLVNMKGRIYDPRVGRFLQADPFVPSPLNGQSFNRYSYVRNSPPNFVDPSGYEECNGQQCPEKKEGPPILVPPPNVTVDGSGMVTIWVRGPRRSGTGESYEDGERQGGGATGLTGAIAGPDGGPGVDATDTGGCRGCGLGYDERKGGRWGGGEAGGWVTPIDPGPQRSADAHSPSAPYASDDGFQGGAHGGAGWPGAEHEGGDVITGPLVSNMLCAILGCNAANAVRHGEGGQDRVGLGQHAVEMAASMTVAKYLGAVAGVVGRGAGAEVGAVVEGGSQTLFHYTTAAGRAGILESGEMFASQGARHARHGAGQYFADIAPEAIGGRMLSVTPPGQMSMGQLSARLFRVPWNTGRLSHFVEVDVSGLGARQVAPNIWLIEGESGLSIGGRVVRSGATLP